MCFLHSHCTYCIYTSALKLFQSFLLIFFIIIHITVIFLYDFSFFSLVIFSSCVFLFVPGYYESHVAKFLFRSQFAFIVLFTLNHFGFCTKYQQQHRTLSSLTHIQYMPCAGVFHFRITPTPMFRCFFSRLCILFSIFIAIGQIRIFSEFTVMEFN